MSQVKKTFNDLKSDIIDSGLCVSCGTCEAVCPVNVIKLVDTLPELVGKCIECGICYGNCPSASFDEKSLEEKIFGRKRKPEEQLIGVYQKAYAAKTTSSDIQTHAQDGGVVTALLTQFLKDGGDAVIVAGLEADKIWVPTPVVAKSREEVIKAAGSKYTPSPSLVGVKKAVKEDKLEKIAVVGTTCQMRGLSLATMGPLRNKKIADAVALKIGLFCMETFVYADFMNYLKENEVDPGRVTKFEIKNGRFYAWAGEERLHRAKLDKVKPLIRTSCTHCKDFTSEFADISVGNVGSPDGYSTVIVRNEKGKQILESAIKSGIIEAEPIEDFDKGETLVHKLAEMKKSSHQ
ncbi:Coenzyme F420 hydrogenase/dehydrogenase, beta subunit C-terminal domain [Candidatus Bathyarchaeota archaeon]|nr:Coenzyme F420 hydrogenase/dehydrogenase, beta subunit C-terminal domain [Candidatus Bathyarchaeota archaeon]